MEGTIWVGSWEWVWLFQIKDRGQRYSCLEGSHVKIRGVWDTSASSGGAVEGVRGQGQALGVEPVAAHHVGGGCFHLQWRGAWSDLCFGGLLLRHEQLFSWKRAKTQTTKALRSLRGVTTTWKVDKGDPQGVWVGDEYENYEEVNPRMDSIH